VSAISPDLNTSALFFLHPMQEKVVVDYRPSRVAIGLFADNDYYKVKNQSSAVTNKDDPFVFNSASEYLRSQKSIDDFVQDGNFIVNRNDVQNYLVENPPTQAILHEISQAISMRLKEPNKQLLSLVYDPESNSNYLELIIRQNEYQEDLFEIIDNLYTEYSSILQSTDGWIHTTTDFEPLV